jgi:dihydroorotate dehydrogenase electron transfer subunit
MRQGKLFLKDKKTYYNYVILHFLTDEKEFLEAKPASFFMLSSSTLLKKPISVFSVSKKDAMVSFLIKAVGKGTDNLYNLPVGATVDAIGPLGNSFPYYKGNKYILVGGGSGIPPLYFFAQNLEKSEYTVIYGGRTNKDIVPVFNKKHSYMEITEDGSKGIKGNVIDGINRLITQTPEFKDGIIISCGPVGMVKAIDKNFPNFTHFTSLESYMGCGFGVCLGCVVKTTDGFKRVCMDGPVFNIRELIFND